MSARLAAEIKQTRPFASLEEEAALELAKTYETISHRAIEFFRAYQLTPTQYNILRILRGAGKDGVTCSQAAERMVTADPDVTRLMDRLEARKLLRRERSTEDRRVVVSRITDEGLALLKTIDKPLQEYHRKQFAGMGKEQIRQFLEMLESLRNG